MSDDYLWRGFKAYAVGLALQIRRKIGVSPAARLDVSLLAKAYEIQIVYMDKVPCELEVARYFMQENPSKLSGFIISESGRSAMLINPAQDPARRVSTIAHEASHLILDHDPGMGRVADNECSARSRGQEAEASWLAAEILLPQGVARKAVFNREELETLASRFGVSIDIARWRTNICGARQMVRARN